MNILLTFLGIVALSLIAVPVTHWLSYAKGRHVEFNQANSLEGFNYNILAQAVDAFNPELSDSLDHDSFWHKLLKTFPFLVFAPVVYVFGLWKRSPPSVAIPASSQLSVDSAHVGSAFLKIRQQTNSLSDIEARLLDDFPDHQAEIAALLAVAKHGLNKNLKQGVGANPNISAFAKNMQSKTGLSADLCTWALKTWERCA